MTPEIKENFREIFDKIQLLQRSIDEYLEDLTEESEAYELTREFQCGVESAFDELNNVSDLI